MIENKIIPYERSAAWWQCSSSLPEATDPGRFEDYARKMYPQYPPQRADLDHWPCIGEAPLIDRAADVLKVWPMREPIRRLPPAQFNPLLE